MPDFSDIIKKDIIKVNRETEARIYRIFKQLEINGESVIKKTNDDSDWESTLKRIGRRSQPLLDNNVIDRPLISDFPNEKYRDIRLISVPKNVVVEEKPGNMISEFHFKRRRIF